MDLKNLSTKIEKLSAKYYRELHRVKSRKPMKVVVETENGDKREIREQVTARERKQILYRVSRYSGISFKYMVNLLKVETWDE